MAVPRESATLVLMRERPGSDPQLLLVRRHALDEAIYRKKHFLLVHPDRKAWKNGNILDCS